MELAALLHLISITPKCWSSGFILRDVHSGRCLLSEQASLIHIGNLSQLVSLVLDLPECLEVFLGVFFFFVS